MKKILNYIKQIEVALPLMAATILIATFIINCKIDSLSTEIPTPASAVTAAKTFDTSVLENWCGGTEGTVRMVSGWKLEEAGENIQLEDETGNIWEVENLSTISYDDFLLLWIADNNTPDNINDDIVVKVWQESWG